MVEILLEATTALWDWWTVTNRIFFKQLWSYRRQDSGVVSITLTESDVSEDGSIIMSTMMSTRADAMSAMKICYLNLTFSNEQVPAWNSIKNRCDSVSVYTIHERLHHIQTPWE